MSHVNKNLSPLLLLALFINVTTFSMNAKAVKIYIYNYVTTHDKLVTIHCDTEMGDLGSFNLPYDRKYEIEINPMKVACDFKWDGGVLYYHMMYNPSSNTPSDKCTTCVWLLRPKPGGLCYHKSSGSEECYKYDG